MGKISGNPESKVYTAQEIQEILQLGKNKIYDYLEEVYRAQQPFKVMKIGKLYRVSKESFDHWMDGD